MVAPADPHPAAFGRFPLPEEEGRSAAATDPFPLGGKSLPPGEDPGVARSAG